MNAHGSRLTEYVTHYSNFRGKPRKEAFSASHQIGQSDELIRAILSIEWCGVGNATQQAPNSAFPVEF